MIMKLIKQIGIKIMKIIIVRKGGHVVTDIIPMCKRRDKFI